ncbi:MAG: hypothetical protein BMS9Abin17_1477 [Acidimicrobiia bacterium]|nr:MAG: hypothetical protein BMS9Abin17_1477 [Acidimicrobiia bacterium]
MSDLFLVLHVLAGALWFGGAVYVEGLLAGAARSKDPSTIMTVGLHAGRTNQRLFNVAGVTVFITGILIVLDGSRSWKFDMIFVSIGFALSIFVLALSLFYFKPNSEELDELIEEHGLTSDEAMAKGKQLGNMSHFVTLLLTIAIIAMVLKPGS